MDGTALIEMLRSMSQAGYSGGASFGNGPVAAHQQQHGDPASDAMVPPDAHTGQQPASMAPAQPDAPAPAAEAPAKAQPTGVEPAQHADTAMMDSGALPHAPPGAQPEQQTADRREPADMSALAVPQMLEPEQPAEAVSAAPSQQAAEAAQPLLQQALVAPSLSEAPAPPQLVPAAQAPEEQPESAAPPAGLQKQPGIPDGVGSTVIRDAEQQAEDAALAQPSVAHGDSPGNTNGMQGGQDTIMHDAGEADASHVQADVFKLPALAEPAEPAAPDHVEHTTNFGSTEGAQAATLQEATPASSAGVEHGTGLSQTLPAESLREQVIATQEGSAREQSQPGAPADSGAAAEPAAPTTDDMQHSAANASAKLSEDDAAAEQDHHGPGNVAEEPPHHSSAAMDIDHSAACGEGSELPASDAVEGAAPGNFPVPGPDGQIPGDGGPDISTPHRDSQAVDEGGAAVTAAVVSKVQAG